MTTPFDPAGLDGPAHDEFAFDAEAGAALAPRRRSRRKLALIPVVGILGAGAVLAVANPFAASAATPSSVTARATTATIVSSVSISGQVAAATADELNFSAAGTVNAVNVKAGDTVTAGQVLATIDATSLQAQITTAQANLAAAQARLALDQAGPTAATKASAADSVAQAELALTTAEQNLSNTNLKDAQSISQAKAAVSAAEATLAADQAAVPANPAQVAKDQQAVASAQQALSSAQLNASIAAQQAQSQVSSASLGVTSAQHGYALKIVPTTAAQLDSDKAAVASAQQALANLQATGTQITSPIAGTVTAVNLTVGQQVSGPSAGGSSSSSSSSTTGQIEVMDLSSLQIAGQASETDIAKLKVGQAATITAAATGSNTVVGQVCSVGLVGTQISGVTSYPVTVCLSGKGTGLLVGMSATAAVQTSRADNAVVVPSLAVRTTGGQATVTVLGADGTTQTVMPVTTGISNGSQTQITSGLSAGATVVESVQASSGSGASRGTGFGGGGTRTFTGIGGGFGG